MRHKHIRPVYRLLLGIRKMHIPAHNAESDPAILRQFIQNNPLGILTTAIRSDVHPLIQSSHIPWIVDDVNARGESGMGRLRGHIARQNPQAKAIIEALTTEDSNSTGADTYLSDDVLVIFNNPVHHYVTPKFYQDTKPTTGKVVPTWNYEAVQVYGTAKIYFDTQTPAFGEFLSKQIDDLSDHAETSIMGYGKDENSKPWRVTDAPPRYIELLTKNIIGIEIDIKSMAGRFKMSQEKPKGDRAGVIKGFQDMGSILGPQIAEIIEDRSAAYDLKKERAKALKA